MLAVWALLCFGNKMISIQIAAYQGAAVVSFPLGKQERKRNVLRKCKKFCPPLDELRIFTTLTARRRNIIQIHVLLFWYTSMCVYNG